METPKNKGEAAGEAAENKAKDHGNIPSFWSRVCLQPVSYANCAPTSDAAEAAEQSFKTHAVFN